MPRISTETLVLIASVGGFVVGGTGYYFRRKIILETKALPCYTAGMNVLREHPGAQKVLGLPIRDLKFDIDDTSTNYWNNQTASFSIHVRGSQAAGQYQFWAQKNPEGWNVTKAELTIASIQGKILAIKREQE